MNTINRISKRANTLTQENLFTFNRVIDCHNYNHAVWKGTKYSTHLLK